MHSFFRDIKTVFTSRSCNNLFSVLFVLLTLLSCAPPSPEYEEQTFVPKKDVLADSLYEQGVDLFKAGRFIDSEMKLRQALYLFPEAQNIKSNLALVLKSNGLYQESDDIYLELVKNYPEAYDYQFALADSYFREKKYKDAIRYYDKARIGFEMLPDPNKAAQSSRSIASIQFLMGNESLAYCNSEEAYNYLQVPEQIYRHVKLLLAMSFYQKALEFISPLLTDLSNIKDPMLIKLGGVVYYANQKMDDAKKLLSLSEESRSAGQMEVDSELQIIGDIIKFKFPDKEDSSESENKDKTEDRDKSEIFNLQVMLYWPVNLVTDYFEMLTALPKDSDS